MTSSPPDLAPVYLLKPYSSMSKNLYKTMLMYYYRDGGVQGDIIKFYYRVRGRDLWVSDLSRDDALRLIRENRFTVYMYRDVSRPDLYSFCQDVVFDEVRVGEGLYTSLD